MKYAWYHSLFNGSCNVVYFFEILIYSFLGKRLPNKCENSTTHNTIIEHNDKCTRMVYTLDNVTPQEQLEVHLQGDRDTISYSVATSLTSHKRCSLRPSLPPPSSRVLYPTHLSAMIFRAAAKVVLWGYVGWRC